ncbi:MAG: hypothetical protein V4568_19340 [Pseudomonadota bacterium]
MPLNIGSVPVSNNSNIANILNFKPPVIRPGVLTKQLSFDDPGINDGTVVNNIYIGSGVQLATLKPSTPTTVVALPDSKANGPVYARTYRPTRASNRNLLSVIPNISTSADHPTDPGFDERSGIIQVTFANTVRFVSVLAVGVPQAEEALTSSAQVYARAFDVDGNLLHESNYPLWDPTAKNQAPGFGAWLQLGYTSSITNIRYLLLSSTAPATGGHVYAAFDTLMFY